MKKILSMFLILALAIMTLALVTSCGGGSEGGSGDQPGEGGGDQPGEGGGDQPGEGGGDQPGEGGDQPGEGGGDQPGEGGGDQPGEGGGDQPGEGGGDQPGEGGGEEYGSVFEEFSPAASITNGYGGTNGIIVLMTDNDSGDFETLFRMDELYRKYDLVGGIGMVAKNLYYDTAYTQLKERDVSLWNEFLNTGRWSVICHSMTHKAYGTGSGASFVVDQNRLYEEIVESAVKLRAAFPSQRVLTYAMTGNASSVNGGSNSLREGEKELIGKYYIGGRFGGNPAAPAESLKWNELPYTLLSLGNLNSILNTVDSCANDGKFFLVYNHYIIDDDLLDVVGESSWTTYSAAETMCQRIAQHKEAGTLWNAQFEDAVMYMREKTTATLSVSWVDGAVKIVLTDEMDDEIYYHDLTVKLSVPSGCEAVKVTQGDRVSYAKVFTEGGASYVYVNVRPDGGEATVLPASLSEVPEVEKSEPAPTPSFFGDELDEICDFENIESAYRKYVRLSAGSIDSGALVVEKDGDKALKLAQPKAVRQAHLDFGVTEKNSKANVTIFDADILVEHIEGGKEFYVGLRKETAINMYQTAISYDVSSGKIKLTDYSSAKDNTTVITKAKLGEWFNLRIEYYDDTDGSVKVKVYVEDQLLLVSTKYYHVEHGKAVSANRSGFMRISTHATFVGNIYLDNVSLTQSVKTYVDEIPEENTVKIPEIHTFDDFDIQIGASFTYAAASASTGTLTVKKDDKDNSYMHLTKLVKGESSSVTFSPTKKEENANVFVLETEMCLTHTEGASKDFYVSFRTSKGNIAYNAFFEVSNGSNLTFKDFYKDSAGKSVVSAAKTLNAKAGEWFKFRLEFHEGTRDTLSFKIYANDQLVGESRVYHSISGSIADASDISSIIFNPGSNFLGEASFDNLSAKAIFIEKDESDSPSDPEKPDTVTPGALTFDDSSAIGTSIIQSSATNATLTVTKDGENGVLSFEKTSSGGQPTISIGSFDTDGEIFVYEAKMKLDRTSASGDVYLRLFSGDTTVYYGWFSFTSGGLIFTEYNDDKITNPVSDIGAVEGEWFKLRIEYVGGDRENLKFNIYVNGSLVHSSSYYYATTGNVIAPADVTTAKLNFSSAYVGNMLIDNLLVRHENEGDGTSDAIGFDDGKIPEAITGTSGTAVTHTIVDTGEGNKALRVQKLSTGWNKAGLFAMVSESEENADTFIFECDMLVTQFNQMAIYITNPETTTDNNTYYTGIISNGTSAVTFGAATAPAGEWVHFRLEYTKIENEGVISGRTTITIGDSTAIFVKADTIDFDKINMIMFAVQSATIHDTIYDNIVCKKVCSTAE
ncbi:MAG: hypothetical protein IJY69_02850 [Clostridia bacterium]|nr:hypothetical protein [Clostridia bacterium]